MILSKEMATPLHYYDMHDWSTLESSLASILSFENWDYSIAKRVSGAFAAQWMDYMIRM